MTELQQCPIETAFHRTSLHKKWTLTIIRDMFLGLKHFSDYLKTNEGLSPKVLSQRLKDMEKEGLIRKEITSQSPIEVEYSLTTKGIDLKKVLFEFSMYGAKYFTKTVFGHEEIDVNDAIDTFGGGFMIDQTDLDRLKVPTVSKTYA